MFVEFCGSDLFKDLKHNLELHVTMMLVIYM